MFFKSSYLYKLIISCHYYKKYGIYLVYIIIPKTTPVNVVVVCECMSQILEWTIYTLPISCHFRRYLIVFFLNKIRFLRTATTHAICIFTPTYNMVVTEKKQRNTYGTISIIGCFYISASQRKLFIKEGFLWNGIAQKSINA